MPKRPVVAVVMEKPEGVQASESEPEVEASQLLKELRDSDFKISRRKFVKKIEVDRRCRPGKSVGCQP